MERTYKVTSAQTKRNARYDRIRKAAGEQHASQELRDAVRELDLHWGWLAPDARIDALLGAAEKLIRVSPAEMSRLRGMLGLPEPSRGRITHELSTGLVRPWRPGDDEASGTVVTNGG